MDNINGLLGGFADVITPMNLLIALLGVLIGTAIGLDPGSAAMPEVERDDLHAPGRVAAKSMHR